MTRDVVEAAREDVVIGAARRRPQSEIRSTMLRLTSHDAHPALIPFIPNNALDSAWAQAEIEGREPIRTP